MPVTKLDNRIRVSPELWRAFLNACAATGVPYKEALSALITYFVLTEELPSKQKSSTGNSYYAPQSIPTVGPPETSEGHSIPHVRTSEPYINQLLDDDLFT